MYKSMCAASVAIILLMTGCATPTPTTEPAVVAVAPVTETPTPAPVVPEFSTTGWDIDIDVMSPFYDRVQKNPHDAELDDTGLVQHRDRFTREIVPHPIANAQFAMAALLEWENTGDPMWLDRAVRNGQHLIDTHVDREGAWWFQYEWDWTYIDRTIAAPWWSGMAQGEALTVFSRLARIQPENPVWLDAAERTFASFLQRGSGNTTGPWSTTIDNGHLWFEEYAGDQPPLLVLNGQVFAVFGLWEYYQLTEDPIAAQYIDGGATAVLATMPLFRAEGDVSYYCVAVYCLDKGWQNGSYHSIHVSQLLALSRMTGDARFSEWAALLDSDFQL